MDHLTPGSPLSDHSSRTVQVPVNAPQPKEAKAPLKEFGQVAFEAFCDAHEGQHLPEHQLATNKWEDLTPKLQRAWEEAAQAAIGHLRTIKHGS